MALIAQSDLENRATVAEVARYSRGTTALITSAIAQAVSKARSAALNVFTAASWDAMTSATLPAEALYYLVSDAIDILSAGSSRPAEIQIKADEATKWRSYLAGGTVHCFDGILARVVSSTGAGGDRFRIGVPIETNKPIPVGSPTLTFDRDDDNSELRFRVRKI